LGAIGTPGDTTGVFGNAQSFTGDDAWYLAKASCPNLFVSTSQSITFWFKLSSKDTYQCPVMRATNDSSNGVGVAVLNTNALSYYFNGLTPDRNNPAFTVDVDIWYFCAVVYDSVAGTVAQYLDGSSTSTSVTGTITTTGTGFAIGRFGGWGGFYFNGVVDDVTYFDRALTPTEINTIYTGS